MKLTPERSEKSLEAASTLRNALEESADILRDALGEQPAAPRLREIGTVIQVGGGIARVRGLQGVRSEELVRFSNGLLGIALNLDEQEIGVVLLGGDETLRAGTPVHRTHRVVDTPVGEPLLGRVVDPIGRPLDGRGPLGSSERRPIERPAPAIMDRAPVTVPLQTGLKVVDALIPIGRGQRELIVGDRQTGKTAVAVETLINQRDGDVFGIYCAIGQPASSVAKVVDDLRRHHALERCIAIASFGDDPPGLQFITPYSAMTIAESFVERGRDVLVVLDDLTRHARAYRQLSLLLRRPPGREAYPGDIFYIHSRLLERATHLRDEFGGGSLTALPIIETEEQNIAAYIPTNLISITDGQIYLSPELFRKGNLPAVDVGKSVSRVGGRAQLPAYRAVAGELRLAYSQFEELETFSRFGTRLDEETRKAIERGWRVREILRQPQYASLSPGEQIGVLLAVTEGLFDELPVDSVPEAEAAVLRGVGDILERLRSRIDGGEELSDEDREHMLVAAREAIEQSPEGQARRASRGDS